MPILKVIALVIILVYMVAAVLLYFFQTRLIFQPSKLSQDYKFRSVPVREEVFIETIDGNKINGLFFPGRDTSRVILYFHGNAGDLSGWQFVAEDLLPSGLSVLIIDYRGYGKSTGYISEQGLYNDGQASYNFLTEIKKIKGTSILIYGRSIGTGVATEIASNNICAGLVLESPYQSLSILADEKLPFFFPSFYLKAKFNNSKKIRKIKCPVALLHGKNDTLIPSSHSEKLFDQCTAKKMFIVIEGGQHNDLHAFPGFRNFIANSLPSFFFANAGYQLHDN